MTQTAIRNIFVAGTILFSAVFLYLSYDSLKQMPNRTHEENLTPQVAAGKWVWQKYNCNDCHTILGIGGYYAPDVTKVAKYRTQDWLGRFLRDPQGVWAAKRQMPKFNFAPGEVDNLIAFLGWVGNIDTNGWPPKPMMFAAAPEVSGQGEVEAKRSEGAKQFALQGCQGCHMINGVGGRIGPDLTHIGKDLPDVQWHIKHLKDPAAVHPGSAMPAFSALSEDQLEELAEYLVSLK